VSFDNSRFLFDPFKDYTGVVMEQGRVQLDSDWNEWLAEVLRRTQAGVLDTMGRAAYPATTPAAFQITASSSGGANTIKIGVGRMYVDGLLAENHGDPAAAVWDPALAELSGSPQPPPATPATIDFTKQPYLPGATVPAGSGQYLAYLDIWTRPVTFLEDLKLIDDAVGVDTTGRLQTVWQVRLKPVPSGQTWNCSTPESDFGFPVSSGRLSNGTITSGPSGPCCLTTGTGYVGVENQFYRVEIHEPGSVGGAGATFKWSRENASVQTSVSAINPGTNTLGAASSVLTVGSLGRDQVLGFAAGNWIEITDDTHQLNGLAGELYKIDRVDVSSQTITLTEPLKSSFDLTANARILRWDQSGKIYDDSNTSIDDLDTVGGDGHPNGFHGIPVPTDGSKVVLENGIVIDVSLSSATGSYQTGDFWTFSARTAKGTIDPLVKAPPRGIHHHYTPLSIVTLGATAGATDCRTPWPLPSADECGCCTSTVGDGILSHGKYTSIQAAIDALPDNGGEICILPGNYFEHVVLQDLSNVVIHGCEWQTHIFSPSMNPNKSNDSSKNDSTEGSPAESGFAAVFTIIDCDHIDLHSFSVHADKDEVGILLDRSSRNSGDSDISIKELLVTASTLPAIFAVDVKRLRIAENRIAMQNVKSLYASVCISGEDMFFERNWIGLQTIDDVAVIRNGLKSAYAGASGDSSHTSIDEKILKSIHITVDSMKDFATAKASGGIQIAGPSENVLVLENEIVGGSRNGITLGNLIRLDAEVYTPIGVILDYEPDCSPGGSGSVPGTTPGNDPHPIGAGDIIRNLRIDRNRIHKMGMCGIGPVGFFNLEQVFEVVSIINLSITANIISNTLLRNLAALQEGVSPFAYGAISIPDVQNLSIRDNVITNFGVLPGADACGIFVLHGERVEISRNQINESRPPTQLSERINERLRKLNTMQAGISLFLVTPPMRDSSDSSDLTSSSDSGSGSSNSTSTPGTTMFTGKTEINQTGASKEFSTTNRFMDSPIYSPMLPALRLQENVVRVAFGLALEALGYGVFEISDNHLSTGSAASVSQVPMRTLEMNRSADAFAAAGSGSIVAALTVAVFNLGLALEDTNPGYGYAKLFESAGSKRLEDEAGLADASSGTVLFTNNACQFDAGDIAIHAYASVMIASLNHVLFANNQLWFDGPSFTAVLDAFLFGVTLQVCANRFQEARAYPVLVSGLTAGLANITSQNLSTYCLKATGIPTLLMDRENIVLDSTLCRKRRVGEKLVDGVATKVEVAKTKETA
jgi:hypothetical protein